MNKRFLYICFVLFMCFSCKKEDYEIDLKWNKAHPEDTFERHKIGLKWALSYLGSTIASDTLLKGISYKDSIITLNVKHLGFSEEASSILARLQYKFKESEKYKRENAMDIGRYIALTFGTPDHYYRIVNIPLSLSEYQNIYEFDSSMGYIDNSSVSHVDRIISYSKITENNHQGFISVEVDSISKDSLEFETMQLMPNGKFKFGIYNISGQLKSSADPYVTRAGAPAKCIWCHEVSVLPLFKPQNTFNGFLSYKQLADSLISFNKSLDSYQNSIWMDKDIVNKKLHTEMELVYISFMEPNAQRLSIEWGLSLEEVKKRLAHLETHKHEEFPFLGDLYHRKDVDKLAPDVALEVPESIREQSNNNINLLN